MPLLYENRILVKHGLKVLAGKQRPGIHALCEISGVSEELATSDITYRLAPRINATGRLGAPTDSLRLLEADNMVDAANLARKLDEQNRERQTIEEMVVTDAEASEFDAFHRRLERRLASRRRRHRGLTADP